MRELTADVAVIGAGSGGLSVAAGAAQLGLQVVLFERGPMGGDCLNYGCVPSKALIAAADAAHAAEASSRFGVRTSVDVDFAAVMTHVRNAIAAIEPHDSQERFEQLGVTVVRQAARFSGPRTIESQDVRVRARKIVLATGSRPQAPEIEGLSDVPYLTNETVFDLRERPDHLLIIGAGPIGLEIGQAFRRLGSQVTVLEAMQPLPHEDPEAVEPLLEQLRGDGLHLVSGVQIQHAGVGRSGVMLRIAEEGRTRDISGSHLLVATGRAPNIEDLGLEAGDVVHNRRGVVVDTSLQSVSNPAVYAVGDVVGREAFTHVAGAHAGLVIRRIAFGLPVNVDKLVIPRVTYADPEIASVGLSEREARQRHGEEVRTLIRRFADNDRAVTESDTRGLAKLVLTRRGRLLGITIVGSGAGELIQPWVLAMSAKLPLRRMASLVAPYPTRGEISRGIAGDWYSPSLFSSRTRAIVRILKRLR